MKSNHWMKHALVQQVTVPSHGLVSLTTNERPKHWAQKKANSSLYCCCWHHHHHYSFLYSFWHWVLLPWLVLCRAIHRLTSGSYIPCNLCLNARSSTSSWNDILHRLCILKRKEQIAPWTSSRRTEYNKHRLHSAWCNETRQTICNHMGFNNHVIFKIWLFLLQLARIVLFKCWIQMKNTLQVRKCACVLEQVAAVLTSQSLQLKPKQKMLIKNWTWRMINLVIYNFYKNEGKTSTALWAMYVEKLRHLPLEKATSPFAVKVTRILTYGLEQIWNHLTVKNLTILRMWRWRILDGHSVNVCMRRHDLRTLWVGSPS